MPRGGEREGAGNKAASQSAEKVYLCSVCGTGHEFKTRKLLNQHEKTASHKRKIDPEFAAVEKTEGNKAASQSAEKTFLCSVCGTGHDFKSRSHLIQHEKTASHKSKIDPEFAAVEEAEKAAEKATNKTARDTKETDRLKKRRRTKAEKQLASAKNQNSLDFTLNKLRETQLHR